MSLTPLILRFQAQSAVAMHHREMVQGDDGYRLGAPWAHYNSHFAPEMAACSRADNRVFLDTLL